MINVMLVDDHAVLRAGIESIFMSEADMKIVASVSSCEEALARLPDAKPDVCIVDLRMSDGMDGIELVGRIAGGASTAPYVIVFSAYDTEEDVFRAMSSGAKGFISKLSSGEDLVAVVRRVARGERVLPNDLAVKMRNRENREVLSQRQMEILGLLASGLSNKEMAARLFLSEDTVKWHLRIIYKRLGVRDRVEAIGKASSLGIVRL